MNCNNHHLSSMESNPWSSCSHMDELNNALDPITILTDADLQNELNLYATTQFTFDGLPNLPIKDNPTIIDHSYQHPPPPPHPIHHHPPNLVMNINNNDPFSSANSSPNDPQQHYFTPISSLPTSPALHDLGDHLHQEMNNPLLAMMLSPTSSHQYNVMPEQQPDDHYMNRSVSMDNTMTLNDTTHGITTISKYQPIARRRQVTTRGRPRRQQQQQPVVGDHDMVTQSESSSNSSSGGSGDVEDDVTPVGLSKRQRNTAASARFRIKKKMREQCLQRTACEMTNKANFMENKVHELEREIKWLKTLLVAKNGCGYC